MLCTLIDGVRYSKDKITINVTGIKDTGSGVAKLLDQDGNVISNDTKGDSTSSFLLDKNGTYEGYKIRVIDNMEESKWSKRL